jgi:hypothetical protein
LRRPHEVDEARARGDRRGGTPDYDGMSLKKTANGVEGSRKKAGKVVQTYTRVASADGKTMTVTSTGTTAAGAKVDNLQVYDKQ